MTAFVVDERYFTIKDLARLGLGRIAHEQGEYDDAYYHYFQIPDDSAYLPDALFEASWSMYQKRELATARDLVHEFLATFPSSPLWPEASLLAGYVGRRLAITWREARAGTSRSPASSGGLLPRISNGALRTERGGLSRGS